MRVWTNLVLVTLASTGATAQPAPALTFTPRDGAIVIPVVVNGEGPFDGILDTGSNRTLVSDRLAARLELVAIARSQMVTPAGAGAHRPIVNARLELHGLSSTNVRALVAPFPPVVAGQPVDVIVGQDLLAPLVYTIDYEHRRIRWHDAGHALATGERLPLQVEHGQALVMSRQSAGDAAPLMLVPDTGADSLVLFARPGRALPDMTPLDVGRLASVAGQRLGRRARVDALRLGSVVLLDQMAVVLPADSADGALGDGLLPLHGFARVTFNAPAGWLAIEPRRGR